MKYDSEFCRRVYEVCSKIPKGKTMSYKEISDILHSSPRAVGQALKKNPNAPQVPCHRVIHADGSIGGYSGVRDSEKKVIMLKKEGVKIKDGKVLK